MQGSVHRRLHMRCVAAQVTATAMACAATCPANRGSGSRCLCSAGAGRGRGRQGIGRGRDGGDGLRVSALQVQQAAHAVRHLRQCLLSLLIGPGAPTVSLIVRGSRQRDLSVLSMLAACGDWRFYHAERRSAGNAWIWPTEHRLVAGVLGHGCWLLARRVLDS